MRLAQRILFFVFFISLAGMVIVVSPRWQGPITKRAEAFANSLAQEYQDYKASESVPGEQVAHAASRRKGPKSISVRQDAGVAVSPTPATEIAPTPGSDDTEVCGEAQPGVLDTKMVPGWGCIGAKQVPQQTERLPR